MNNTPCFLPTDILLPNVGLESWSVIACDQFTSEPEYWEKAAALVGNTPSTLKLILPECYLTSDNTERINDINANMADYINKGFFKEYKNSMIYVERLQSDGIIRQGIIGKCDLEQYDYAEGSTTAIRATEKTVISRIPPRVEIRKDAPLELPHIMLLIDDDKKQIIEPLAYKKQNFTKLYDFELMLGGGHVTGYLLDDETVKDITDGLQALSDKNNGLTLCVGDGNHSLATAKECYNLNKTELNRYALAEFVNIHSEALEFEPIYRVVFGADPDALINKFIEYCGGEYQGLDAQSFDCYFGREKRQISVKPKAKLAVGTLQTFLDEYLADKEEIEVDYIHGIDALIKLSKKENAIGFLFDGMKKEELFAAVKQDGSLPRKTFSMGHAADKRYYLEARKIK